MKHYLLTLFALCGFVVLGQTPNSHTFAIEEFLLWDSSKVEKEIISSEPLSSRAIGKQQVKDSMNASFKVLYAPDGMDNFARMPNMPQKFNYFNFSHWQYIDIFSWFGGSAAIPVLIPTKEWIDAAHKNGVKIIGSVFFAHIPWGGKEQAVVDFLQTDDNGNYVAIKQLKAMAKKHNFDGWMLHFETHVKREVADKVGVFIKKLKEEYSGEVIWYDALVENGSVSWQNELTDLNAYYFKTTTGLMTNYWWREYQLKSSHKKALYLKKTPYDIYTGIDLWPGRQAQRAFVNNAWLKQICTKEENHTSIGLYATNVTYNFAEHSNFFKDSSDVYRLYATERKLFSGMDENPFLFDKDYEGISAYIPAKTVITSLPFVTHFNLGHGLKHYLKGEVTDSIQWTNLSVQDIPVTWAFKKGNLKKVSYDFDEAFNGGSSLKIESDTATTHTLPLFSTEFTVTGRRLFVKMAVKTEGNTLTNPVTLVLIAIDGSETRVHLVFGNEGAWEEEIEKITLKKKGLIFSKILLELKSNEPFVLNIGEIVLAEKRKQRKQKGI